MKLLLSLLLLMTAAFAQPRIFYSDLDSGPKTGGLSNNGVFITVYGKGFGSTQGTVTIGGGTAAAYQSWTDTKITFQPGAAAQSGSIVVNGSNPLPFTIRSGNIFLVTTTGSDSAAGSFSAPWKTSLHALAAIAPGDTVYIRAGAGPVVDDGQGWSSCMTIGANAGTAGNPKAFVAYPGDTVQWGSPTACGYGIRAKGQGENYWTIAGFNLAGQTIGINPYGEAGWRIIGNDITCPNGNGQAGCMDIQNGGPYFIYGNNIHNVGTNLSPGVVTALYHGVYLSDSVFTVDFGWNTIAFIQGCRGLQQNSNNDKSNAYGLLIHDNVIHDTQCDGIVMTTVDPSKGPVRIYNNIIYNAGKGPNNAEGSGTWACINSQSYDAASGPVGSGTIEIYNNTMFACGTFANPPYEDSSGGMLMYGSGNKHWKISNNIVYLTTAQPYLSVSNPDQSDCAVNCPLISGGNNLWYGGGTFPSYYSTLPGSVTANPMFVSTMLNNFRLQAGSPAALAGQISPDVTDFDGVVLPQGSAFPIGAFSIPTGGVVPPPPPPPPVVTITLTPTAITLAAGKTQQFLATVTGSSNTGVTWSATMGSISAGGLYTAPTSLVGSATAVVRAVSSADGTKSASATVTLTPTVTPPPPPPPTCSVYDLDCDGVVTQKDVDSAIAQAAGTLACTTGDVNKDGKCDGIDAALVLWKFLGKLP